MPTYEYRCTKCKHKFEEMQTMSAPPLETCPECGGPAERVISGGAGLIFKGDGFYITDNRSSGYKKDAKNDAPPSSHDSKSDSKPDSKSKSTSDSTSDSKPASKSGSSPKKSES